MRLFLAGLACFLLSGCVFTGSDPQVFSCEKFESFTSDYAVTPSFLDIQAAANVDLPNTGDPEKAVMALAFSARTAPTKPYENDPIYQAILSSSDQEIPVDAAMPMGVNRLFMVQKDRTKRLLLLSGGGQWGAYGAGFLSELSRAGNLPKFDAITGVSTGGIQALFIGMGELAALEEVYSQSEQSDIIDKGGSLSVLSKGYLSNLSPLRKRIEERLCESKDKCSGLEKLAKSPTIITIGVVELGTGNFRALNITNMAKAAYGGVKTENSEKLILSPEQAQQCIVSTVLASASMPIFFQPVSIENKTYVDGGVRLSVFEAVNADMAEAAAKDSSGKVAVYIIRNGPTIVQPDKKEGKAYVVDANANAKNVALRSYSTIVNQSEVSSIAMMRLLRPKGQIFYTTADGYRGTANCPRKTSDPFEPEFMRCLVAWGKQRAQAAVPWRPLPEVIFDEKTGRFVKSTDITDALVTGD